jgi:hypothetical protein
MGTGWQSIVLAIDRQCRLKSGDGELAAGAQVFGANLTRTPPDRNFNAIAVAENVLIGLEIGIRRDIDEHMIDGIPASDPYASIPGSLSDQLPDAVFQRKELLCIHGAYSTKRHAKLSRTEVMSQA